MYLFRFIQRNPITWTYLRRVNILYIRVKISSAITEGKISAVIREVKISAAIRGGKIPAAIREVKKFSLWISLHNSEIFKTKWQPCIFIA